MKSQSLLLSLDLSEVDGLILKILSRNPFGLPVGTLWKDLPPSHRISKGQLTMRLNDLFASGKLWAWYPPAGKAKKPPSPIYSKDPLDHLIADQTVKLLAAKELTLTEIKKHFPGHISKYLKIFLDPLIKNKTIKWHPPLRGKRLGLQEPNPLDFLSAEIKKVIEKGRKLGFQEEIIFEAIQQFVKPSYKPKPPLLTSEEAEHLIFKAMTTIKPAAAHGALVYIPDLRKALRDRFPDKKSFDQAVLNLAKLEKVQLQSHSLPSELTEEQRTAMIDNERGSYFMAIGIRME